MGRWGSAANAGSVGCAPRAGAGLGVAKRSSGWNVGPVGGAAVGSIGVAEVVAETVVGAKVADAARDASGESPTAM